MFESLIQKVEDHPKYGPAMAKAAAGKVPLVLDYHTHTTASDYCVSICSKAPSPVQILNLGPGELEELVHVGGFGKTEAECVPLATALGKALFAHYDLAELPEVYLNGQPLPEAPSSAEERGA